MSFADKVHALRALFKVPDDVPLRLDTRPALSASTPHARAARRPCVVASN